MILPDFKGFPRVGRILGIDWGARRTGIAVSDETRGFVFVRPTLVVARDVSVADMVADIAMTEKVVGIVVGLPVRSDGTESDTSAAVRVFANELDKIVGLPICFVEENLTSVAAQEQMGRVNVRQIKQKLDSESARIILENAIGIIGRLNC